MLSHSQLSSPKLFQFQEDPLKLNTGTGWSISMETGTVYYLPFG